jgi:hypothetical protein
MGDAEAPTFVRASVSVVESIPVVRAKDYQHDWDKAVNNLIAILQKKADRSQVEEVPSVTAEDLAEYQERREQLRAYIESLKADLNLEERKSD